MTGYQLHPAAFADIEAIPKYIATDDADAADRAVHAIFSAIRVVADDLPHSGFRRPNLTSRTIRFTVARPYVIAYAPERKPL